MTIYAAVKEHDRKCSKNIPNIPNLLSINTKASNIANLNHSVSYYTEKHMFHIALNGHTSTVFKVQSKTRSVMLSAQN